MLPPSHAPTSLPALHVCTSAALLYPTRSSISASPSSTLPSTFRTALLILDSTVLACCPGGGARQWGWECACEVPTCGLAVKHVGMRKLDGQEQGRREKRRERRWDKKNRERGRNRRVVMKKRNRPQEKRPSSTQDAFVRIDG
ncbi:hypothetical protein B0H19DRAFT_1081314 [Mycena capillaripes]|nr:hypothetical protein B0H19DRAFT_1081314 [Mycena capillaripes]